MNVPLLVKKSWWCLGYLQVVLVRWNEPFQKLATCDMEGGIFVWIQYEGRWSVELVNDRGAQVDIFFLQIWAKIALFSIFMVFNTFVLQLMQQKGCIFLALTSCVITLMIEIFKLGEWLHLVPWWHSSPHCIQRWVCVSWLGQRSKTLVLWD